MNRQFNDSSRIALAAKLFLLQIGWLVTPVLAQNPTVSKSEAQFDVVVEKDVRMAVRDGTKLAVDLYRPAREGKPIDDKLPVLLSRTPYNKNGMTAEARWFAGRGYAVALASFGTEADAQCLASYLDRYLPRLDLAESAQRGRLGPSGAI